MKRSFIRQRVGFSRRKNLMATSQRQTISRRDGSALGSAIFRSVVCGVDGTAGSEEALGQAIRLQNANGSLLLVTATQLANATLAGGFGYDTGLQQQDAEAVLAEARALAPTARSKLVHGDPAEALLREAEDASLVCVGSPDHGRAAGLVLGTVAARMLRDAPCSILIARPCRKLEAWPLTIVVGVDGSDGSVSALAAARFLGDGFGGRVHAIAATADALDSERAREMEPEVREDPRHALDALRAASEFADLVVVGSRGLHGLLALGSVSERIAHQARSSVLVVRQRDSH